MAIEARNINKRFGDYLALDDVSVSVPDGSLTALLGPSGSGKSTLLRVIAGLERPDSGNVLIGREDVTSKPARSRGVGFVFQHYAAFKHMTVSDNVAFGLTVRKKPKAEKQARPPKPPKPEKQPKAQKKQKDEKGDKEKCKDEKERAKLKDK
jgi:sulfate transport system ATP-binding protein